MRFEPATADAYNNLVDKMGFREFMIEFEEIGRLPRYEVKDMRSDEVVAIAFLDNPSQEYKYLVQT